MSGHGRRDPSNAQAETLLFDLLQADSEDDVIGLPSDVRLWNDDAAWRFYNDDECNYDRAGNQQRNPEAALVEKLINSVDARLMLRCLERGIDPESEQAPHTMRDAVAIFYEGAEPERVREHQGSLVEWTTAQRTEIAREMSVAITGGKALAGGLPSITISDAGEGQAPERMPDTLLSLSRGIKQGIPFVQGKWNQGGTGALRFCGKRNLQLVVSKRAPTLASRERLSELWGFTVVRRDDPQEHRDVSTYRYLAPVGSASAAQRGGLLTVNRETLPIFPEGQRAYSRESGWGTLIKLYEYDTRFKSHMFRKGGLQERFDLLIPGLALPVRLHECRDYGGDARSFETTLSGLTVRLTDSENLEDGFPDSGEIAIGGEHIGVTLYAFKRDRASTYRRGEGILFVVNGQTHGAIASRFFHKKTVGMSYLADSLLVVLDCSELSSRTKEELFMNSRDRLADRELAQRIEEEVGDLIRRHDRLRALRDERRQEDLAAALGDAKPVEDALRSILRRSPTFAALFLKGTRLSNPFATAEAEVGEKFVGRAHPTLFKFKDRPYGEMLVRNCHMGQRLRITFETDVVNDYFRRRASRGRLSVDASRNDMAVTIDYAMNLHDGFAHLNVRLPDGTQVNDTLRLRVIVTDPTLIDPFISEAVVTIRREQVIAPRPPGQRREREKPSTNGHTELRPSGLALPAIKEVHRDEWERRKMDQYSALRVEQATAEGDDGAAPIYDFYVNVDNVYLSTEMKSSRLKAELLKERFKYGLVLTGLGVLRYKLQSQESAAGEGGTDDGPQIEIEDLVSEATDALAPVLLPMIESLGQLDLDALVVDAEAEGAGED